MVPSLASIRETWIATTDHESVWVKLGVVATTGVVGFIFVWNLIGIWKQLFGYWSVVGTPITILIHLFLYFYLSRAVERIRG